MVTPPIDAPIWINRPLDLYAMIQDLIRLPILAVDTESNSLYAYHEKVCLIQFSTGEKDYLVDPLALDDLSLLNDVFSNPSIEKIFHAAEYDIICLKRDFGFSFANLFDTMQAARILGRESVGLASLLKEEFGVSIDKHFQRANWSKRPLTPAQLAYARQDTFYLIPLRHRLKASLEQMGWLSLADEDFQRLCQVSQPSENNQPPAFWRIAGSRDLSASQAAILQALCEYRDQEARVANLPPFKVFNDSVLLEIALANPHDLDDLATVRGLSHRQMDHHGEGLLKAIQNGMREKPPVRHLSPRPSEAFLSRLDALRTWRKETGEAFGVPSDVILPRDTLELIAEANPQQMEALADVMSGLPYRLERFGSEILEVLHR